MKKRLSENPNVFVDFHHASLLQSFILLFENRLGGNVYRPIGIEWAQKGYWAVYDHPATQQQFLSLAQGLLPEDKTRPLNNIDRVEDDVYYCQDIDSGYLNKAITYDKFMSMDIDIVIASLPQHINPFVKLVNEHPKKPKAIYQIGNSWNVEGSMMIKNVMSSALVSIPEWINSVTYHQEFDQEIFYFREPAKTKNISSYVNCFDVTPHFKNDYEIFKQVETMLDTWDFKIYGGQCRDGSQDGSRNLAGSMANDRFIWHTKFGGDGYGHILFNTASVGRPTIVNKKYYAGKLGEKLLIDGITCIDTNGLDPVQIVEKINYFNQPENYNRMVSSVRKNFKENVNFDREAQGLKLFIENLK